MNDPRTLLVESLRRPETIPGLPLPRLDTLVRQARRTNLLAKIAIRLEDAGCLDKVHPQPRAHFVSERIFADKHRRDVLWEVRCLERALVDFPKVVLLKGAAYIDRRPSGGARPHLQRRRPDGAEGADRRCGVDAAQPRLDRRCDQCLRPALLPHLDAPDPAADPFPARDRDRRAPHHRAGDVAHAGRGGQAVRRGAESARLAQHVRPGAGGHGAAQRRAPVRRGRVRRRPARSRRHARPAYAFRRGAGLLGRAVAARRGNGADDVALPGDAFHARAVRHRRSRFDAAEARSPTGGRGRASPC